MVMGCKQMMRTSFAGLLLLALGACGEDVLILDGERQGVREAQGVTEPQIEVERAFTAPPQVTSQSWTHRGGSVSRYIAHPALASQISQVWSANIGSGNGRKARITADPVVSDGTIFTLDSAAKVFATSTSGASLWSRDLVPSTDRAGDASGGGLAVDGNLLVVTTGFGDIYALNRADGAVIWRQQLDAPVTASPTISDGLIYVVTRDNSAWALDTKVGRIKWRLPGTPAPAVIAGGSGAVVNDRLAIFPFGSGELVAALKRSGIRVWGSSVSGQRRGVAYASITDISGDPVLVGGKIYAANQGGRAVAIDAGNGERLWTADEGAYSPVYPAGNSVFLISDRAELVRLDAETGAKIWSQELPYYTRSRLKRRDAIYAHFGPLLAGGRLVVASEDGFIRSFSPETGALLSEQPLRAGAASNPVVVNGTLYVITTNGQLTAFR